MQGLDLPEVQLGLLFPHLGNRQGQATAVRARVHEAGIQRNLYVHQRSGKFRFKYSKVKTDLLYFKVPNWHFLVC